MRAVSDGTVWWAAERSVWTVMALEDSAHGLAAALAAGLTAVAVPSAITVHTDLSAAHHTVPSLTALTVDLLRNLVAA